MLHNSLTIANCHTSPSVLLNYIRRFIFTARILQIATEPMMLLRNPSNKVVRCLLKLSGIRASSLFLVCRLNSFISQITQVHEQIFF